MDHDVIIIGAGPAGLFASIGAAEQGATVLLVERMPSPARKLLASGGGQCNLTHAGAMDDFLGHYGSEKGGVAAGRFLKPSLYAFGRAALGSFCAERGLALETTYEGKVFPATRRAHDLLDLLVKEAKRLGVTIGTGRRALSAQRDGEGFRIGFEAGASEACRSLVIATGGKSYASTGSSGDGWLIAAGLGHRIVEPAPALAPVIVAGGTLAGGTCPPFAPFAACSGNAIRDTAIAVYRKGRKVAAGRGDVLITHRGLSGPGILDLSRGMRQGDELRVALAPGMGTVEEVGRKLLAEIDGHGGRGLFRLVQAFGLVESVARALLASHSLPADMRSSLLTRTGRQLLASSLAEGGDAGHPFRIASLGSWDEAMVSAGGVALEEVDPKTMQSRLVPGLCLAGEVLDIDGDTGGYNIQAAISTGRLAGACAATRLQERTARL